MKTRLAVNGTPIQPHACAVLLFPALSISTTKLVNEDSATNGAAGSPEQGEIRSADQATQGLFLFLFFNLSGYTWVARDCAGHWTCSRCAWTARSGGALAASCSAAAALAGCGVRNAVAVLPCSAAAPVLAAAAGGATWGRGTEGWGSAAVLVFVCLACWT